VDLHRVGGSIVNQSSTAAWMAIAGFYGLAKAALNYLTAAPAHELAPRNIRINAIAPGPTDTEALGKQVPDAFREPLVAMMAAVTPGDPNDPATMMGPLIRAAQRDRVERYVTGAVAQGARVVAGGRRPASQSRGALRWLPPERNRSGDGRSRIRGVPRDHGLRPPGARAGNLRRAHQRSSPRNTASAPPSMNTT
jgi:hypothetical protein